MDRKIFQFEVKEVSEEGQFEGHAAVYGNKDLGDDMFEPGVFAESIAKNKGKVPVLLDHRASVMNNAGFGIWAGEDSKGLPVKAELNLLKEAGREGHAMMMQAKRLKIKIALSVGFTIAQGGAFFKKGIRHITKADLWEYSIVIWGMNPKAGVSSVKSLKELTDPEEINWKKKNLEQILRDADCSQTEAKRAISVLFQRDVEPVDCDLKSLIETVSKQNEQLKSY